MASNPGPLTQREREVLDLLLSVDFPGVEQLRIQAEKAGVAKRSPGFIHFETEPGSPYADVLGRVPVEAWSNTDPPMEVLLFIDGDGQLDFLELVTYDGSEVDEPPAAGDLEPPKARPAPQVDPPVG